MTESIGLKFLLLGSTEVGKTTFLERYMGEPFLEKTTATVGIDYQEKVLTRDGKAITMQIWDTAGQERYRSITTAYYRGANGFVLVFSLNGRESFTSLPNWINSVKEKTDSTDVPFVLAGNKSDLTDERVVSTEEAQKYAESVGCPYFETSSKDNTNISEVFDALLQQALKQEPDRPKSPAQPETEITAETSEHLDGSDKPKPRKPSFCSC